jgi:hypothetical protein
LGLIANILKGLGVGGGSGGDGGGGNKGGKAAFEAGVKAAKTYYNGYKDAQVQEGIFIMCSNGYKDDQVEKTIIKNNNKKQ